MREAGVPVWIRLALRAFPPEFRAQHGAEMAEDWLEERSRCRTRGEAVLKALTTALDLTRSGLRERRFAEQATRRARRRRARWGGRVLDNFVRDLKHSVRALVRRPGFTVVAIVTLALGASPFQESALRDR